MFKVVVSSLVLSLPLLSSLVTAAESPPSVKSKIVAAEDARDVQAPALAAAARSKSPTVRARAALAYGRIQKPEAIDALLSLLQDPEVSVKKSATFALGQLGFVAAATAGRELTIADALMPAMKDPSASVRVATIEAIGKLALLSTPDRVLPALKDVSPSVRAEALLALMRFRLVQKAKDATVVIPPLSDAAFADLAALVQDSSPRVRQCLAYYFSRVVDARASQLLVTLSQDAETWVRHFAAVALGKLPAPAAPEVVSALAALAKDRVYTIRTAAVVGLAASHSEKQIPVTLEKDPTFHVRTALATAAVSPDLDESLLRRLLKDRSRTVRAAALTSAVKRFPAEASALLTAAATDADSVIRLAAIDASGALGEAQAAFAIKGLSDSAVLVRDSALAALSTVATTEAYSAIVSKLTSTQLSERDSAVGSLAGRAETDIAQHIWETYRASPGRGWDGVRMDCVDVLSQIPGDETKADLILAVQDSASAVARHAVEALRARGVTDQAMPQLKVESFSPYRGLTFKQNPILILETIRGRVEVELFAKAAPIHTATIVGFARAHGYDGLPWHRVVSNFVVQGGDPDRTGYGDAGFSLRAEVNPVRFTRGTLGMPRGADFDSGGVQLFITHVPTPHLDGQYTVFGRVRAGMKIIDRLEVGDRIVHASVKTQ